MRPARAILVIGVGNRLRGDDAAGPVVADRLRRDAPAGVYFEEASGEGARLIDAWQGADTVIAIDAVASDGPPGTIHRFEAADEELPTRFFRYSTHAFGLAEAIEVARRLGQLPRRLVVYGIEGQRFDAGDELSPPVEEATRRVVSRIRDDLARLATRTLSSPDRNPAPRSS